MAKNIGLLAQNSAFMHGNLFAQGILAIIPGMLLVGFAVSPYMLYTGLLLYSFGKYNLPCLHTSLE